MNIKNYIDMTEEWFKNAIPNSHKVKCSNYFIDDDGVFHPIKGKEKVCISNKNSDEFKVAVILENIFGGEFYLQPRIETAKGYKGIVSVPSPDYKWNNVKWDLKTPGLSGKWENAVERFFKNPTRVRRQVCKYIIDFKNFPDKLDEEIIFLVLNTLRNPHRDFIENIIIMRENRVIKVYSRI